MSPRYWIPLLWLLLIAAAPTRGETALDRYVARPDPAYEYGLYARDDTLSYTSYFLRMISQNWRHPEEVDRTTWEHDLQITVPAVRHSPSPKTALLIINGGKNGRPPNTETGEAMATLALTSGMVVAMINQIPNQPLYFADEVDHPRTEDAILAYSLDRFLETGDEEWPVHLAMTKAVVRAMDTVQAFLGERNIPIQDFILLGGSKRGWTTWLTAAVDARVKAIVPISIDLLHMDQQFTHHWEALGFYSPAIADYEAFDLPCRSRSKLGQDLLAIIDPYRYRDRYQLPKLLINSAGDEFFLSDSWRFYYEELPGPKWLRYTFNTGHAQGEDTEQLLDVALAALAWIRTLNAGQEPPRYQWWLAADGTIRVLAEDRPDAVFLVQATNPDARDFRLPVIGQAWTRTPLQDQGGGLFVGSVSLPEQGWRAFAVELVYGKTGWDRQIYTSGVRIVPDVLPFAGTACQANTPGFLDNPQPGGTYSGIGVLSGWACEAKNLDLRIDDQWVVATSYGTPRSDTQGICGDQNNGFGLLLNLNLLGDGEHQITAMADGRDLASARFSVQTLGQEFLSGLSATYELQDFPGPGQHTQVSWEESLQNFLITGVSGSPIPFATAPTASTPNELGQLENPRDGSIQSGISVISGWICDAQSVAVRIDDRDPIPVAYGTARGDTQGICGDQNNGFGLSFNWNLLGDGRHRIQVLADGDREIATSTFQVVTLGGEFQRGLEGTFSLPDFPSPGQTTRIQWQESLQNFSIQSLMH